ncbi:hypothetical protein BDW71DRAFT_178185 [Aspergillus fruticulosus]
MKPTAEDRANNAALTQRSLGYCRPDVSGRHNAPSASPRGMGKLRVFFIWRQPPDLDVIGYPSGSAAEAKHRDWRQCPRAKVDVRSSGLERITVSSTSVADILELYSILMENSSLRMGTAGGRLPSRTPVAVVPGPAKPAISLQAANSMLAILCQKGCLAVISRT